MKDYKELDVTCTEWSISVVELTIIIIIFIKKSINYNV